MPAYHKHPDRERYDVIVIGGGMGGLSAGVSLAREGARVLVLEAHYRAGGYAHAFRRRQFLFDAAVHLTPGGGEGGLLTNLLAEWGVADQVEFLPVQPMYRTIAPGREVLVASGKEAFIQSHVEQFPGEAQGIRALVETMDRMSREIRSLSDGGDSSMRSMVRTCPTVVRYGYRTMQQLFDDFVKDPELQALLGALWPYLGLPPSRCSAVAFTAMAMAFVNEHAWYVKGSFQKLVDAFVLALQRAGGELVMPRRAERLLFDRQGRVSGVRLDGGDELQAECVISNADAFQTFFELAGPERLPQGFAENLQARPLSISAFEVFLGAKLDLAGTNLQHENFYAPSHDADLVYDSHASGQVMGCGITIPTLVDTSVAPPGHHVVCLTMFAPWERIWSQEKQALADRMIDEAEQLVPGLRASIVCQEAGTPATMQRYTGNHKGAIYGWDFSPASLVSRLSMETPLPGLFLSGHWTRPGCGLYAVVLSGQLAARRVVRELERVTC